MKLLSVNVSLPREIEHEGKRLTTGIFKRPVEGRVRIERMNLEGDGQGDPTVHGGIHKAVYAYPVEHYVHWSKELGREDFVHGQCGENLTVEGPTEANVYVGDLFQVGEAVLEVTQPRAPCFKLGIRMGLATFPRLFLRSGRSGFYLRVVEEGEVAAGDRIARVHRDPYGMSIQAIHRLLHADTNDRDGAKRALRIEALAPGLRATLEKRLREPE